MTHTERLRFEAVLPFYVNGSAETADRAFVDALLHDPEAAAMLDWHQGLARHVHADVESVDDAIGWAALMGKVRAQHQTEAASALQQPDAWKRWFNLDRWLPRSLQMPAFAALVLLVVGQSVWLALDYRDPAIDAPHGAVRGSPETRLPAAGMASVIVSFKDETPERQLRLLLVTAGATIVQGPGQLGDYTLEVPQERQPEVVRQLRESEWVTLVQPVDPARLRP